jgi:hypothetical protein
MNKKQKVVAGIAIALFALTLLCAPWESHVGANAYNEAAPIWSPPDSYKGNGTQLRVAVLLVEWVGIAVLYGAFFLIFRPRPSSKPNV